MMPPIQGDPNDANKSQSGLTGEIDAISCMVYVEK